MNNTQETMRKEQERDRAVMHLDDYLCEASISDFVGIINDAMQKHYNNNADKIIFNAGTQQRIELTKRNWSKVGRRIATALPCHCGVEEFATSVAEVLRNEYGSHNFLIFIIRLINELDNDTIG
tara:strand:- start:1765 stop:2136 length:372 start_codon:yes stop_codon:yes gene_type:complete